MKRRQVKLRDCTTARRFLHSDPLYCSNTTVTRRAEKERCVVKKVHVSMHACGSVPMSSYGYGAPLDEPSSELRYKHV